MDHKALLEADKVIKVLKEDYRIGKTAVSF
jgi:hypothetical protein